MAESDISVVQRVKAEEFYNTSIADALEACQKKHVAQFMPTMIDTRIASPKGARVWQNWFSTPSIRATGKTTKGSNVVVYAHVPNYFSVPANIRKAIQTGLRNYAGVMPQREFQRLVDLDESKDAQGNRLVWVVEHEKLKSSKSGVISVGEALEHPQTIPFVGGEDKAKSYLVKHKEAYDTENMGNHHVDDLQSDGVPVGRLLFVGDFVNFGLLGRKLINIYNNGRFVGVPVSAAGTAQKIYVPNQLGKILSEYIAPRNMDEVKSRISALHN